jgi:hypothetical protein
MLVPSVNGTPLRMRSPATWPHGDASAHALQGRTIRHDMLSVAANFHSILDSPRTAVLSSAPWPA